MVQPLAVSDDLRSQANTNLSRSVSLSIVDEDGNEASVRTTTDQPIELIIPRDPNLVLPPMTLQNVSSKYLVAPNSQTYNLHYVNLVSQASSAALHFEMRPSDASLGYLLIYRFDRSPQLNRSSQSHRWMDTFLSVERLSSHVFPRTISKHRITSRSFLVCER